MPHRSLFDRLKAWIGRPRDAGGSPRVLVIDDGVPDVLVGAGAPRAVRFLAALVGAGAKVTLFPTVRPVDANLKVDRRIAKVAIVAAGTLSGLASFLRDRHSAFDVIVASRRHNLIALNDALLETPAIGVGKTILFDSEAIFAEREDLQRSLMPVPPGFSVSEEVALARNAHAVIAVNERDAATFRRFGHPNVRVLGHAIDVKLTEAPFAKRSTWLFVGPATADDTPNGDSIVWFVDRALPLIRAALDAPIMLTHVGQGGAPAIRARQGQTIDARGAIRDLTGEYNRARVFIAPTRFAAGLPLKVGEAAAAGVPCVVTPLLASQLGWIHEREVLVAEGPEDFAAECVRLYTDEGLWHRIRTTAAARVMADCDARHFDAVVAEICRAMRPA